MAGFSYSQNETNTWGLSSDGSEILSTVMNCLIACMPAYHFRLNCQLSSVHKLHMYKLDCRSVEIQSGVKGCNATHPHKFSCPLCNGVASCRRGRDDGGGGRGRRDDVQGGGPDAGHGRRSPQVGPSYFSDSIICK